jgi:hypothetical protein
MLAFVQYAPYELADGSWDEERRSRDSTSAAPERTRAEG